MTMKVRVEALAWAIAQLPPATVDSQPFIAIPVSEVRESNEPVLSDDIKTSATFQRLVFKREIYAQGKERWYEWTLDIGG